MMKVNSQPIEVKNLDHLGLVAGLLDDIGIVPIINELLGEHQAEKIKAGQVVKAMILNGLGLVSSPLYLFSRFFEGKATEHLLGQGIQAKHLNDDRWGRVLDQLYQVGLNQVFMLIVLAVVEKYVIEVKTVHLDSSSFQVEGEYKSEESSSEEGEYPHRIKITYGYSRDKRPDLKQFMMDLICSEDGDIPLWMRIGDGNESDSQKFAQLMKEFKAQMTWESLIVLDSAFYTQANIQTARGIQCFQSIHVLVVDSRIIISNLTDERLSLLKFFPPACQRYYLLS